MAFGPRFTAFARERGFDPATLSGFNARESTNEWQVVMQHQLTPVVAVKRDKSALVLDEVQSIQGDSAGELIAGLKVYLESGRYSRGRTMGTAEASFVMLGNIMLDGG